MTRTLTHDPFRRLPSLIFPLLQAGTPGEVRAGIESSLGLLVGYDALTIVEVERSELQAAFLRDADSHGGESVTHAELEQLIERGSPGTRLGSHGEHATVALVAHGVLLGALRVDRFSGEGFERTELDALHAYGALAALALHGAHVRAELRHLAYVDPLTGLANRRRLFEEIDARLQAGREFALLFLDLDGLKPVNDRHGHVAGDLLIVSVAEVLAGQMREGELAARFGGDEFVALVAPAPEAEQARRSRAIENVVASIELPRYVDDHFRGASVEIVPVLGNDDPDSLVVRGSKRMHARKVARKGGVDPDGV